LRFDFAYCRDSCDKLDDFVNEAISSGREPLVEVHNKKELDIALSTDTGIIALTTGILHQ